MSKRNFSAMRRTRSFGLDRKGHHDECRRIAVFAAFVDERFQRLYRIADHLDQVIVLSADPMAFHHIGRILTKRNEMIAIFCMKENSMCPIY